MPMTARSKTIPWSILSLEFVSVVFGILGALWVDSWWQDREDRILETRYLTRLHQDLIASREILNEEIEEHKTRVSKLRSALEELKAEPTEAGLEILRETLGYASELHIYTPEHSTYDEMIATGTLGLITNDSIRQALSGYDRWIQRLSDVDAAVVNQYILVSEPVLWESFIPYDVVIPGDTDAWSVADSPFPFDSASLYGNRRLWNVLNSRLELTMACLVFREHLLSALESATSLIEQELAKRGQPLENDMEQKEQT